jgi:hypothetical protein
VTTRGKPVAERFWSKVAMGDGCWMWCGAVKPNGYGHAHGEGQKQYSAHRLAWELVNGPISGGLHVCHSCDNRQCVRPSHLFLGTNGDNMRDMVRKGRARPAALVGERNPSAKLSEVEVQKIRAEYVPFKVTRATLATRYGVSVPLINKILARKVWHHVGA